MKRTLLAACAAALLLIPASNAWSWGIGASFGLNDLGGNPGQNVMASIKLDETPFLFGIGGRISDGNVTLGLTADWWMVHKNLVNFLNYYIGPGLYFALSEEIELGGRLPIGINAYPLDPLELFLEIAPTIALLAPEGIEFPNLGLQGAIGFRFWF